MLNFNSCEIETLSAHQVGNKTNEEELIISDQSLDISDETLRALLSRYFLSPFSGEEFYNFTFSNGEFELNPLFNYSTSIFKDDIPFHENSIKIAQYLYDVSVHPNIKSGDLFIVHFSNIRLNDQPTEAIGIFKSENKHPFLTIHNAGDTIAIDHSNGINIDKLDKGCLVFNRNKEEGFRICIIDKSNKSTEAQYWKDVFLNLSPCNDGFHNTKEFLNIAKTYVKDQLSEEFQVEKTDQIDILNRSVEYFKSHDSFDKDEFEETVFQDKDVIQSFRSFDNSYREENEIELKDNFDISSEAVKKQSRFFKSILKLDKNFHVYIHGDKSLIERGVENDGRKFYKIYYENEK